MKTLLNQIQSPKDLKEMNISQLQNLSQDIRDVIIEKVNVTGGHMGSNLGMVEATIALHYVFDSPVDKIVFDVSHQCYTHKILTGRQQGFMDADHYYTFSGYTNPNESIHDHFIVGHTSTSVSLATGLAKGRDLTGANGNVIAIIGDGSLSGGEAYEGLNNAAMLGSNMIVIVNDNDMSIAPNAGGIYNNLRELRASQGDAKCNIFKALGFDYYFLNDGNDLESLIDLFGNIKNSDHPVVVHMCTQKGKGLSLAEENQEYWHWSRPGDVTSGVTQKTSESYVSLTTDYLLDKCQKDSTVVVISPGTPGATGLSPEIRATLGQQYIDVGIAEEHAVAYASGVAKNGGKPVIQVLSSFVQRTYDQLSQDLSLNQNPATILIYGGGISGADATHLGTFDVSMISHIPGLVYLSPANKEDYLAMLEWSLDQKDIPVIIRVPAGPVISQPQKITFDLNRIYHYETLKKGQGIAIIAEGHFVSKALYVSKILEEKYQLCTTVIHPYQLTSLDEATLSALTANHQLVVTLEDGCKDGGFGERIARYYGTSSMKVMNFGSDKEFTDRVTLEELYSRYRLHNDDIVEDIYSLYSK